MDNQEEKEMEGRYCMVRSKSAGVFAGTVEKVDGQTALQFARELAKKLRAEQGTLDGDLDEWIANRTYPREALVLAATGNVAALAKVREEAGLPVLA